MGKFLKMAQVTKESLISAMLAETGWKSIDPKFLSLIKDNLGRNVGIYTTGTSNRGNPIMGYVYVLPEHRNKGYAHKAAKEFKKKHPNMEWRAAKDNKVSQHVADKLGLKMIDEEDGEYIFKGASIKLLHGSPFQNLKKLLPEASKFKKVFATNSKQLATRYMADGTGHRVIDKHRFLLNSNTEKLRGAKGSIYKVESSHFALDPHKGNLSWVYSSPKTEKILGEKKYDSVLKALNDEKIISVPPKYFKHFTKKEVPKQLLDDLIGKQNELIKVGEFAPGLPQKGVKTALPSSEKLQEWEFVVQEHLADRRGRHLDLRLAPPGGVGFSWVVNEIPKAGQRTHAIRVDDHTKDYFDFTGKIEKGYGKGEVNQLYRGKVDVVSAKPNKITFYWYGNSGTKLDKFTLIDVYGSDKWLLLNHTDTVALNRQKNIAPLKYKDLSGGKYVKQTNDFETPKIDGASSVVVLQGGKIPVVYSKRTSKRTGQKIEYTPKIPKLLETRVPKDFGTTVLRAEVFAVGKDGKELPNRLLGGLLNSSVQKSRAMQQMGGIPLRLAGFDVVKYKGKKVDNLDIQEKYKIIQEISNKFPIIEDPLQINQKIPFSEGKVIWREGTPLKVKDKKDYDVYVREIYPNINNDRAGGIKYSYSPFGPIVGNVGTGWKHNELKDMLNNPSKYIGRVAKISAQEKHPSGALRAPSFKSWHLEK
jgi:hypothetical protein